MPLALSLTLAIPVLLLRVTAALKFGASVLPTALRLRIAAVARITLRRGLGLRLWTPLRLWTRLRRRSLGGRRGSLATICWLVEVWICIRRWRLLGISRFARTATTTGWTTTFVHAVLLEKKSGAVRNTPMLRVGRF